MLFPQAKKQFGQHFLHDVNILNNMCSEFEKLLLDNLIICEVGPGQGALTSHLKDRFKNELYMVELDQNMTPNLVNKFNNIKENIFNEDFLEFDFNKLHSTNIALIGNFPYNISSQIIFKIIENRDKIPVMLGMFQKEVAQRICHKPNTKEYGLLSVWAQLFYKTEYLFTVSESSFIPKPKVKSAVISMKRINEMNDFNNDKLLLRILKCAFGQRRKMLRNALSEMEYDLNKIDNSILRQRAEQLNPQQFLEICNSWST